MGDQNLDTGFKNLMNLVELEFVYQIELDFQKTHENSQILIDMISWSVYKILLAQKISLFQWLNSEHPLLNPTLNNLDIKETNLSD